MTKRRTITIQEAKSRVAQWEAQYQEHLHSSWMAERFRDSTPSDVIRMWESGQNERGQKLSQVEFAALVERWLELFGAYPDDTDAVPDASASPAATEQEPEPQDDTMLSPRDVARLAGISIRTIDRMVRRGTFPKPMHLSARRIGWQAREVKAWLRMLDEQRRARRH